MSISETVSEQYPTGHPREQFDAYIMSVEHVLERSLHIPSYQRPYTWAVKNVDQLLSDIHDFQSSGHYRLGTFILHRPPSNDNSRDFENSLDIVDGQQRYLTFGLIMLALSTRADELDRELSEVLLARMKNIEIPRRRDGRSGKNLRQNFNHIQQVLTEWSSKQLNTFTEFFLKECSVVVLEVFDLDAAFQLFDSQNTRGKALFPTDLLKAYHLREFSQSNAPRDAVLETVRKWDAIDPKEIEHLFAGVLFPIKQWSRHLSVPESGFTSEHVDLFKGIRDGNKQYRWAHLALMAKTTVDRYRSDNATLQQYGVIADFEFPFQILEPIIDGEMFFRMVHHYINEARDAGIQRTATNESEPESFQHHADLAPVLERLRAIPGGTGNRYIRELFDCFLMAYLDRFGWSDVHRAADKLARHAYLLRVKLQRVSQQSINNHALYVHHRVTENHENLFTKIALAQSPDVILARPAENFDDELEKLDDTLLRLYAPTSEGTAR